MLIDAVIAGAFWVVLTAGSASLFYWAARQMPDRAEDPAGFRRGRRAQVVHITSWLVFSATSVLSVFVDGREKWAIIIVGCAVIVLLLIYLLHMSYVDAGKEGVTDE